MAELRRVQNPPSSITGDIGAYLRSLAHAINDIPTFSMFSGTTPNSNLTGFPGDLAVNFGSASTDSRIWVKGGSARSQSQLGWVTLRTGPP